MPTRSAMSRVLSPSTPFSTISPRAAAAIAARRSSVLWRDGAEMGGKVIMGTRWIRRSRTSINHLIERAALREVHNGQQLPTADAWLNPKSWQRCDSFGQSHRDRNHVVVGGLPIVFNEG